MKKNGADGLDFCGQHATSPQVTFVIHTERKGKKP